MHIPKLLVFSEKEVRRLKVLYEKQTVTKDNGCILWVLKDKTVATDYVNLWTEMGSCLVHRVYYTVFKGALSEGLFVCHHCDTPACVNPEHLFLGTQRDNIRDMVRKGRNANTVAAAKLQMQSFTTEQLSDFGRRGGKALVKKQFEEGLHPNAKLLTDAQIRDVRVMFRNGASYKEVREIYGITHHQCTNIKLNRSYKDIK